MKPTAPVSYFSYICLAIYFSFGFLFRCIKPKYKNTLLRFILIYFIWHSIYQSITTCSRPRANFWCRYPKGIDNPFNTSGCEYLLYVCRRRLRVVAWFSYRFDNRGLITEGNTYRRCAACRCGTTPMGSQESLLRLPGRRVARRAGLVISTRIVYPGSGREDA